MVRADADGNLVNARPCYHCTLMMKNLGINKIYYSIDNCIVCEKVAQMISINSSNTTRCVDMTHSYAPTNIVAYYRTIINKMPHYTKRHNVNCLIRCIQNEIKDCDYTITKNKLIIVINQHVIGEIGIY